MSRVSTGQIDAAALARVVAGALDDPEVRIEGLERLSGGASRETWSFAAVPGSGGTGRRLVVRRDPPGAPGKGMALEGRLLGAAGKAGVPVPELLAASDDPALLGSAFLLMEHVEGETIPRRILREETFRAVRPRLAHQCGEILARLHSIDPGSVPGLADQDPLASFREALDDLGLPHPAFELAFRWLEGRRPERAPAAIVHGDFRHGNLIIGSDGIRAVLDWELAHRGDPMEDLGWLCVKAWRFGVDRSVGGFGTYEQLMEGYQRAGGRPVLLETLRWWEVLGTLRWGIMCILQASLHTSGAVRSVELAAIGRRVCENEWDLLELMGFS
jgi:aminoglycoside phosphotransferase (APT) family kinase protein